MEHQPICVLGTRTGSSLATRALALLGLDPGSQSHLLEGQPGDNPKGFWEQQPIIDLNDDLLAALGGVWWDMPRLPDSWQEDSRLDALRERARELVRELFPAGGEWVWKDPRATITLPFWQAAIGPMRYVVSARPPAEVAASLGARSEVLHPWRESTRLYFRLLRDSLRHTAGAERIVVFYEDWFDDFDGQVERLARFATGRRPSDTQRTRLRAFFEDDLRHHDATRDRRQLDPEIRDAYALLRESTDGDGQLTLEAEREFEALWLALGERIGDDRDDLRGRSRMGWMLAATRQHELEAATRAREDAVCALDDSLAARADLEARLAEREAELELVRGWLDGVNGSASWRLTAPLRAAKRIATGR
jgi:hypothetical protein